MTAGTIDKLLKLKNPEEYDFKNEIVNVNTYTDDLIIKEQVVLGVDNIKKLKAAGEELPGQRKKILEEQNPINKCLYLFDLNDNIKEFNSFIPDIRKDLRLDVFHCDSAYGNCDLANAIYRSLWDWEWNLIMYKKRHRAIPDSLKDKFPKFPNWDKLGCDTMNSFKTTYNRAVKKIYKKSNQTEYETEFENADDNPYLQKFACLTHSIGNFTLVPYELSGESFNGNRGFKNFKNRDENNTLFVWDYWDLSLKLLKDDLSHEAFKSYIDTFFLNDYVDEDYNIIPLMQSHEKFLKRDKLKLPLKKSDNESESDFLPKSENQLNEYLKNVNCKIKLRGERMVRELEKNLQSPRLRGKA